MKSFAAQRWLGNALLALFTAAVIAGYLRYAGKYPRLVYASGWALFLLMLVLAGYNGRKKLPFLPLGSSEGWLQFHVYAGFATVALFLAHVRMHPPSGIFDGALAALYIAVTGSGVAGLYLSRAIPRRLTTRGGEVLYERIPAIRRGLQEQARGLALASATASRSTTIADFYARHLHAFFERPRNQLLHLMEVRRPVNELLNKITDLNRYLNGEERATLEKISQLVRQKDGLDYHQSQQFLLKAWLFAHIPLTYSLLIFSILHIVLVYAFSGGAR